MAAQEAITIQGTSDQTAELMDVKGTYGLHIKPVTIDAPPDENGVRFATSEEFAALRGRYAYTFATPDALRPTDLVVAKYSDGPHVTGYFVVSTDGEGK